MAVGAQNDLGGGSKLLPEKWLDAWRFSVKIETVFSAQIEVFSKKKKFERFFCPNEGVLQNKKNKKKKKRWRYFGNGVPKYPDYSPK